MATTFVIACPDCGKQVKVTDEHVGKRVKCKECGAVYPVQAPAGAPAGKGPPPVPGKAKPTQAKPPAPPKKATQVSPPPVPGPAPPADVPATGYGFAGDKPDEDEDEGYGGKANPYTLEKTNDTLPRCPFCAKEMESADALICLNCGYNTRTRVRAEVKAVHQPTFGEYFLWLLPGILCVLVMIGLLVWYIVFWTHIEGWLEDSWFEDEKEPQRTYLGGLGPGFMRLYLFLFTAFCYVPLTRFAIRRLIRNTRPPERKIKEDLY